MNVRRRTGIVPFRFNAVTLALLAAMLAGCLAGEHRIECSLETNGRAVALVTGRVPRITVENAGPGRIRLRFESAKGEDDGALDLSLGRITRSLRGPVRVHLQAYPGGAATIRIRARGATGLVLETPPR
jgi:hypothetical protein